LLTHRFLMCETSHNIGLSSCSLLPRLGSRTVQWLFCFGVP
jgi:hypothetical protein